MSVQPSTHDEILATWLEEQGDLQMVLHKHQLSPAQLRDFASDPIVIATMDAHEALLARRGRILASMHMQNAAEMLSKSMFESSSLIESRRAATSLARLTRDMTRPTTRGRDHAGLPASPGPAGGGGRVREAGGGARAPKETTAPAVAPLPLPVALNGERCPKAGKGSSVDLQTTPPAPITHKTREPGRVAPPSPLPLPVALNGERCPKAGKGSSVDLQTTPPAPRAHPTPARDPTKIRRADPRTQPSARPKRAKHQSPL